MGGLCFEHDLPLSTEETARSLWEMLTLWKHYGNKERLIEENRVKGIRYVVKHTGKYCSENSA